MAKCCENGVPSSSTAQPGDLWQCPKCGRAWEHCCDEAEGCEWNEVDYDVTVCAACLRTACWHGESYCEKAASAGLLSKAASELRKRKAEHFDNFTLEKVGKVCGAYPKIRAVA